MGKKKSMIRELINRGFWSNEKEHYELVIRHRGVKDNRLVIKLSDIKEIHGGYLILNNSWIPLHRVVEIRYKGKIIFSRT